MKPRLGTYYHVTISPQAQPHIDSDSLKSSNHLTYFICNNSLPAFVVITFKGIMFDFLFNLIMKHRLQIIQIVSDSDILIFWATFWYVVKD